MIWRGHGDFTYFTCMRCQQKYPIEFMQWDNGLLVCVERCQDRSVNGAAENAWAKAASQDRQELVPDPKLIHPIDPQAQVDTIPASAGAY